MQWLVKLECFICAEGAHALASAYQKLFRRHTHLEQSYPAPHAECKASSEGSWLAFLITNPARTGKYDNASKIWLPYTNWQVTIDAKVWAGPALQKTYLGSHMHQDDP